MSLLIAHWVLTLSSIEKCSTLSKSLHLLSIRCEAPNPRVVTHRMSIHNPSSTSPSVPPEIWLQIFRTATFIPREWDGSATPSYPNEFTSSDGLHTRAYRAVLPLRRAIVQVSRLWWHIGSVVLYASFHESLSRFRKTQALDHFERSLLGFDLFHRGSARPIASRSEYRTYSPVSYISSSTP